MYTSSSPDPPVIVTLPTRLLLVEVDTVVRVTATTSAPVPEVLMSRLPPVMNAP